MTAFARTDGRRVTFLSNNLGTAEAALPAATQKKMVTLESVSFCNTSATSQTVNFYIKTGSDNVYIFRNRPLDAAETAVIDTLSLALQPGFSFAVSAGAAASGVDVTLTTIESSSASDAAGNSLNALRGAQA